MGNLPDQTSGQSLSWQRIGLADKDKEVAL